MITGLWGTPDGAAVHLRRAATTRLVGQPGPAQAGPASRVRRSSSAGTGPEADAPPGRHLRRRVQPGLLARSRRPVPSSQRVAPPARRRGGTRPPWPTRPPRSSAAGATTPRWPPGPRPSAGRSTSCAPTGCAGHPDEVVAKLATYAGVGADAGLPPDPRPRRPRPPGPASPRQVLPHCASTVTAGGLAAGSDGSDAAVAVAATSSPVGQRSATRVRDWARASKEWARVDSMISSAPVRACRSTSPWLDRLGLADQVGGRWRPR